MAKGISCGTDASRTVLKKTSWNTSASFCSAFFLNPQISFSWTSSTKLKQIYDNE